MQSMPITTNVVSSNHAQARCTRYHIMWWSLSVTCDRSVGFLRVLTCIVWPYPSCSNLLPFSLILIIRFVGTIVSDLVWPSSLIFGPCQAVFDTTYVITFTSWIFMVLAHWNNSLLEDMSPHLHTLSWFRAHRSLLWYNYFLIIINCKTKMYVIAVFM